MEKLLYKLARVYNFDLYGRYSMISRVVGANRKSARLKILDVGGYNGQMAEFLPDDNVTILDVFESNDPNYIKGDALHMPFADGAFDVVVSADVFEHIPEPLRDAFVAESYRVSKDFVILAAPFDHPGAHEAEVRANELYKSYTGVDYIWLGEHLSNGLPNNAATERCIKKLGLSYLHIPNNQIDEWEALIKAFFTLDTHKSTKGEALFRRENTKYNLEKNSSPATGMPYRSIYVIGRELKTMPKFVTDDTKSIFAGDKLIKRLLVEHKRISIPSEVRLGEFWAALKGLGLSGGLYTRFIDESRRDTTHLQSELNAAQAELYGIKNSLMFKLARSLKRVLRPARGALRAGAKWGLWFWGKRPYLAPGALWWRYRTGLDLDYRRLYGAIRLPQHPHPKVSVVIPVFNEIHHTIRCLNSLSKHETENSFEVVVLDNGSEDSTQSLLSHVRGLVYARSDSNLGFGDGCNLGVKKSHGEIIIFLNNDTEVLEGWMDALVDGLNLPEAGLVGSKLIYPSGVLQEAGGIIFADGSGWNYGRSGSPDAFSFNYTREVDYCSAASAAITRKVFDDLGGFDPRYSPAYYEDTDLAFAVREQGLKVYYQPRAHLIHYEGGTSGQDLTKGFKKHQLLNRDKFQDKWAQQLARQWRGEEDLLFARDRSTDKRVLVIEHLIPDVTNDSGAVRLTALIKELQGLGYGVTLWPHDQKRSEPQASALQGKGVEIVYGSVRFDEFATSRNGLYDAVILSRADLAGIYVEACRELLPNAKLIFDTVDLAYLRVSRQAEIENSPALLEVSKRWRTIELGVANEADTTIVVSEDEARKVREALPDASVEVISNIHTLKGEGEPFHLREGLVFIGNYNHQPNVDAVVWFCTDIMPLIHKRLPKVKLTIIGSNMRPEIEALSSSHIEAKGYVESVEPYFTTSKVFVSPLRYGAGVKGKVGQSIEYGLPIVTTPTGAEGMHVVHEKDVLIAITAEDFADKVVQLYTDERLWTQLQGNSRKTLLEHFSPEEARKVLAKVLDE